MRLKTNYQFANEADAQMFADAERTNKSPEEDKYVSGPFFMDDDVTFKNMPWANTGRKYWSVVTEIYQ